MELVHNRIVEKMIPYTTSVGRSFDHSQNENIYGLCRRQEDQRQRPRGPTLEEDQHSKNNRLIG